jgi:hypothetical protein
MKKLGIVVVYLVAEEDGDLLDLHLRQIEKNTRSPYIIYGTANRLLPQFRERLAQHPQVRISECPTTEHRGGTEHAHYLEHLIRVAVEDGASHIVILHVDSFPVRTGWEEELAAKLTASCVFVTIEHANTACVFFHRDFYVRYCPTLLLSKDEKASPAYQQYLEKFNTRDHSGVGYGFKAYIEELTWEYLPVSTNIRGHGQIYGDMIFHLVGTTRKRFYPRPKSKYVRLLQRLNLFIPQSAKQWFGTRFSVFIEHLTKKLPQGYAKQKFEPTRKALLEDPEAYLDSIRRCSPE